MRRAIEAAWPRRGCLARALYPLSLVYAAGMAARAGAYRAGVFKRHRLPAPLIVVGNLCAGGSGKTPLVMALAEALQARGFQPGIIARGYKARPGPAGSWPREAQGDADPSAVGDEAVLLARRCRAPVFVGPDRRAAALALLDRHACDIILSDDGFQHLKLRRDLDIVVVDERRFGNGWRLPAGPLRESPAALARADMVVANVGDGGGAHGDAAPGEFRMQTRIERAVQLVQGPGDSPPPEKPLREFAAGAGAGQTVHAVAGLGNPARFFRQLRAHGIDFVAHEFPDHHRFTVADFAFAAAGDRVLMTEKDAVKCESLVAAGALRGEYWTVPLRVELPAEFFAAVVAHLAAAGITATGTVTAA